MELMAAITALESLKRTCTVDLHTDSQVSAQRIMTWIKGWKRNGWKTADRKPVKNVDLGSGSMPRSPTTRCVGTGCAAIPATISRAPRRACPRGDRGGEGGATKRP